MKLVIDDPVFKRFDAITIGVVQGQVLSLRGHAAEIISEMQREALKNLLRLSLDGVREAATITVWRDAYKKLGVNPKRYPPTHEAMALRLLKNGKWPRIGSIVDIYLINQVAHLLPHGGYDVDCLDGDISLTVGQQPYEFDPIGGGREVTEIGEVLYRDAAAVLTRRWNYRDCDRAKITEQTRRFILIVELPSDDSGGRTVAAAVEDLVGRYQSCFDGSFQGCVRVLFSGAGTVEL